jgi:hypothetical protein
VNPLPLAIRLESRSNANEREAELEELSGERQPMVGSALIAGPKSGINEYPSTSAIRTVSYDPGGFELVGAGRAMIRWNLI